MIHIINNCLYLQNRFNCLINNNLLSSELLKDGNNSTSSYSSGMLANKI